MTLRVDNCTVEIDDRQIVCEYTYLFDKEIRWTISMNNGIEYSDGSEIHVFATDTIQEFLFEIQTDIKRAHNLTQVAVAYVIQANDSEPKELFRLCVREEIKLTSKTKSYEFADSILKVLSEKFSKPYSFKYTIPTRKKSKTFWWSVAFGLLAMLLGMFIGLWKTIKY